MEPGHPLELWHSLQTKSKPLFLVMESEVSTSLLQKSVIAYDLALSLEPFSFFVSQVIVFQEVFVHIVEPQFF
jgi:hypothetical protein